MKLNIFQDKNIILGVTGSIAAYKAVDLASKLTQAGAIVHCVLTESAEKFVSPLSFQSVTGKKSFTDQDLWGNEGHVTHIGLGHIADLLLIAPATATTLSRLAQGLGDNLLSVTALAADCPMVIAPAMDGGMYAHPATQANIEILKKRGVTFVGPGEGHLASGLIGPGRLVETHEIIGHLRHILGKGKALDKKKIIVTAGPTQEAIDPVRIITNHSSGKQGYAIAQAALDYGAQVTLITGVTNLDPPIGCKVIHIRSAEEMLQTVLAESQDCYALVMAAAVADFRPVISEDKKIKKTSGSPQIEFEPTQDILKAVSKIRKETDKPEMVIGFAAESNDLIANAKKKMDSKMLDLIIGNDITAKDAGFKVDTNKVILLSMEIVKTCR
ncbi:MAG: bifunctional phosphopantothenoylcysteine decarboxylase/phosphopantothenate--cysteine ligase CoaBC [Anaerolineaceae bacterium]|nr:bifunctional phosphopantothenoylcysteine decarboxylase/phosphopantothenate--cysteine ligase CoaBC [Anaerolineaceae bacterium]